MTYRIKLNKNQKQMKQRSYRLLEMLGILLIIEVLGIAVFFGFTYSMNKYTAHQVIENVQLCARIVQDDLIGDMQLDEERELGSYLTKQKDFSYVGFLSSISGLKISVKPVSKRLCEEMVKKKLKGVKIKVKSPDYSSDSLPCSEGENEIEFSFREIIKQCDASHDCPSGYYCEWPLVHSEHGIIKSRGVCSLCPPDTSCWLSDLSTTTAEQCHRCGDNYFLFMNSFALECGKCNRRDLVKPTSKEECMRCPNRYFDGKYCRLCQEGVVSEDGTKCIYSEK